MNRLLMTTILPRESRMQPELALMPAEVRRLR
jgi:hypothetical protein